MILKYLRLRHINKLNKIITQTIKSLLLYCIDNNLEYSSNWFKLWNTDNRMPIFDKIKNYMINSKDKINVKELNFCIKGYIKYFKLIEIKDNKDSNKMEEYFSTILQIPAELNEFINK